MERKSTSELAGEWETRWPPEETQTHRPAAERTSQKELIAVARHNASGARTRGIPVTVARGSRRNERLKMKTLNAGLPGSKGIKNINATVDCEAVQIVLLKNPTCSDGSKWYGSDEVKI